MATTTDLTTLYIISSITLGVVLSLWVGMRLMIRVDRNMNIALDKLKRMENEQMKIEKKMLKLDSFEANVLRHKFENRNKKRR